MNGQCKTALGIMCYYYNIFSYGFIFDLNYKGHWKSSKPHLDFRIV